MTPLFIHFLYSVWVEFHKLAEIFFRIWSGGILYLALRVYVWREIVSNLKQIPEIIGERLTVSYNPTPIEPVHEIFAVVATTEDHDIVIGDHALPVVDSEKLPGPVAIGVLLLGISLPRYRVLEEAQLQVFTVGDALLHRRHAFEAIVVAVNPSQQPVVVQDEEPLQVPIFLEGLLQHLRHEVKVVLQDN